jgi:hypothetical protein
VWWETCRYKYNVNGVHVCQCQLWPDRRHGGARGGGRPGHAEATAEARQRAAMQAAMSAAEAAQTRAIDKALASQPSERESYRRPAPREQVSSWRRQRGRSRSRAAGYRGAHRSVVGLSVGGLFTFRMKKSSELTKPFMQIVKNARKLLLLGKFRLVGCHGRPR